MKFIPYFYLLSITVLFHGLLSCSSDSVIPTKEQTIDNEYASVNRDRQRFYLKELQIKNENSDLVSKLHFIKNKENELESIDLNLYSLENKGQSKDYRIGFLRKEGVLTSCRVCILGNQCTDVAFCGFDNDGWEDESKFGIYSRKTDKCKMEFYIHFEKNKADKIETIFFSSCRNYTSICNQLHFSYAPNHCLESLKYQHHDVSFVSSISEMGGQFYRMNPFAGLPSYEMAFFTSFVTEYVGDAFRECPVLSLLSLLFMNAETLTNKLTYSTDLKQRCGLGKPNLTREVSFLIQSVDTFYIEESDGLYPNKINMSILDRKGSKQSLANPNFGSEFNRYRLGIPTSRKVNFDLEFFYD